MPRLVETSSSWRDQVPDGLISGIARLYFYGLYRYFAAEHGASIPKVLASSDCSIPQLSCAYESYEKRAS